MGRLGRHGSEHRAGGRGAPGRIVGPAVHLLKGVSLCVCVIEVGREGEGCACGGEDIYAAAGETASRASHPREPGY